MITSEFFDVVSGDLRQPSARTDLDSGDTSKTQCREEDRDLHQLHRSRGDRFSSTMSFSAIFLVCAPAFFHYTVLHILSSISGKYRDANTGAMYARIADGAFDSVHVRRMRTFDVAREPGLDRDQEDRLSSLQEFAMRRRRRPRQVLESGRDFFSKCFEVGHENESGPTFPKIYWRFGLLALVQ